MIGKRHLSEELEINQNYGGVTAYLGTGDAAHTLHGQGARPLLLQFPAAAQPAKGRVPVERGGDDEQSSEAKRLVQQLTDLLLKARKEHYPQQANLHTLFDAGQAKRVADFLPASKKQLSQLSGWGKVKANKMGVWVLEMVEKFVADNPSHLAEAFAKNQAEAAKDNKEVDPDFEGAGASSQWRQKKQRKMPASVGAAPAAAAARDTGGMSRHFAPPQPPPPNGGGPSSSSSSQPGFSQAAPGHSMFDDDDEFDEEALFGPGPLSPVVAPVVAFNVRSHGTQLHAIDNRVLVELGVHPRDVRAIGGDVRIGGVGLELKMAVVPDVDIESNGSIPRSVRALGQRG